MVLIGGTTVLLPSGGFGSAAALEVMEAERITTTFLVPAQWQLLCADPSLASRDLSALKSMSWGAAPASTTLLTRMAEMFPWGRQRRPVRPDGDVAGDLRALALDQLREWGTGRLARYKLPTMLHIVAALPRNASGKVMKTVLRGRFGS
jgi:acyl-CoA synthetase (AMP-forming)/AMP-acid ligase II